MLFSLVAASAVTNAAAALVQLTDVTGTSCAIFSSAVSSDTGVIVFESSCNPTNENADGNSEIFAVDLAGTVVQLTDTVACTNRAWSVSADGSVIAFDSNCDIVGANTDGSLEVFVFDGSVSQVTDGQFCSSAHPSLDGAGSWLAYDSDCDPLGANADGNNEIFRVRTSGTGRKQLTSDASAGGCGSFDASSNAAGDLIAFDSDCDLTGTNVDQVVEIFQVTDRKQVSQISASADDTCGSISPRSNAVGDIVVFESTCDFSGLNVDGSVEIFRRLGDGSIEQLSNDGGDPTCDSTFPQIGNTGDSVTFTSFCDPLGSNADAGFEIFRSDGASLVQITDGTGCDSFSAAVDPLEKVTFYVSDCDPTGANSDRSFELFGQGSCACGAPISQYLNGPLPTASDALFVLRSAVGLATCSLCECDVDSDLRTSATDALIVLTRAVGQGTPLLCPL